MLPQRIGRYDVSAELGRGATSIVYKGVDPADGRVVAIKTLKRDGAEPDDGRRRHPARFPQRGCASSGACAIPASSPSTSSARTACTAGSRWSTSRARNLDELLLRSPLLGQARALAIMDELLDALGCVHREGICHRDVKPANIMRHARRPREAHRLRRGAAARPRPDAGVRRSSARRRSWRPSSSTAARSTTAPTCSPAACCCSCCWAAAARSPARPRR